MAYHCQTCDEYAWGSHWHCLCGSTDTTSHYGHHTIFCKVSKKKETFHHCGPNEDCELHQLEIGNK